MKENLYNLIGREPEKVEGLEVSFEGIKGILVLVPKNDYVKNELTKMDWDINIKTNKGELIKVPLWGYAISPSRFNEYYNINKNGKISKK
ncbi:hypothetical protein COU58_03775 [Candidatus Pacearchaeota archaeon CG10_big_fil_rev_8_21_14_0_10_32_42]|nr:MAG: hypothetical protein COU58_03775 [Candidatus Pacearchaeota archaeon CG10_big_fil_rev_8_21_14_0_10_32_42]